MSIRYTFGPALRLKTSRQFREAFDRGEKQVSRSMVLWVRRQDDSAARLGVVASKKVGNAVARARAKRRLREIFRLHRAEIQPDVDLVLVARGRILNAEWKDVVRDFLYVTRKAGVRSEAPPSSS